MKGTPERNDSIIIRRLLASDQEAMISLDTKITGRRRSEYLKLKLNETLTATGVQIALAADIDGCFAGFLLSRVYYGEFGLMEPAAVLDTIGVHPDFQRRGVGRALLDQLRTDLHGLHVDQLQTQVRWNDPFLLTFFHHEGFQPAPRFCLDLDLTTRPPEREDRL